MRIRFVQDHLPLFFLSQVEFGQAFQFKHGGDDHVYLRLRPWGVLQAHLNADAPGTVFVYVGADGKMLQTDSDALVLPYDTELVVR